MQGASENIGYKNHFHSTPFIVLQRNLSIIRAEKNQKKTHSVHLEADGVYLKLAKLMRGDRKSLEPDGKK